MKFLNLGNQNTCGQDKNDTRKDEFDDEFELKIFLLHALNCNPNGDQREIEKGNYGYGKGDNNLSQNRFFVFEELGKDTYKEESSFWIKDISDPPHGYGLLCRNIGNGVFMIELFKLYFSLAIVIVSD